MLLGNLFKEIRPLLEDQRAPLGLVARFLLSSFPFMLTFVLPWAFLSSVVLVFGRLSGSNELVAMRTSGWSIFRIALPVGVMGVLLSLTCFWLNGTVAPNAKEDLKDLLFEAVKQDPKALLTPGAVQNRLGKDSRIYVQAKAGEELEGFHFYQLSDDPEMKFPTTYINSQRVSVDVSEEKKEISLALNKAFIQTRGSDGKESFIIADQAKPWIFPFPQKKKRKRVSSMTNAEILSDLDSFKEDKKNYLKRIKEIESRNSLAMASLVFGVLGVPIAIQSRRRETSSGFIIALVIAACYFGMVLGLEGVGDTRLMRTIMIWLPNILAVPLSVWLYLKANYR